MFGFTPHWVFIGRVQWVDKQGRKEERTKRYFSACMQNPSIVLLPHPYPSPVVGPLRTERPIRGDLHKSIQTLWIAANFEFENIRLR